MDTSKKISRRTGRHILMRAIQIILMIALVPFVSLVGCQSKLIYSPRPYAAGATALWQQETHGRPIDFRTSQGKQRAFLQGNLKSPRNLWVFCGGNGTLALDWSKWLETYAPPDDAWVLVDFPGYGDCEGAPSPRRIRESLDQVVPLACREMGWPEHPDSRRLRFFGHSLGAGACLIAASDFKIQRGVLLAPFTSTMDMTRQVIGVPLGLLVWHRFDNSARLAELASRGPGKVVILHGKNDEVIPVTMSRTLAAQQKGIIKLKEIPGGRHNDIQEKNADALANALKEAGEN